MAYKISDKAILLESGGETILIAETATFERGGLTILDSDFTLSPTFVSGYFTTFQGTLRGYRSGGSAGSPGSVNTIDDFKNIAIGLPARKPVRQQRRQQQLNVSGLVAPVQ